VRRIRTGATAEIAFDLVQQHGIVSKWQFGYQDGSGQTINCSLTTTKTTTTNKNDSKHATNPKNATYFRGAVASIRDYMVLPSNNYTVLMNVVAQYGPVAVSVACMPWHLYQSGIFYAPMNSSITTTTDLDHLVVLEGYGTDQETGEDYWLVRNSWGPRWGEHGYIRLKRHSQNHEEEKECGYDTTPADGTACTIDPATGDEIVPLPQKICGNSGILFDSAVPIGGYLL
jgi:cathepsin L